VAGQCFTSLKSHGTNRTGGLVWPRAGVDGCRDEKIFFLMIRRPPRSTLCDESHINLIPLISVREKFYEVKNSTYTIFVSLA
jgi:hypothetical protein